MVRQAYQGQKITLGYIAEAGLRLDSANNLLHFLPEQDPDYDTATAILNERQVAPENINEWARQVNRAISTLPPVDVDDHPIG